jgi:hypothetical protein
MMNSQDNLEARELARGAAPLLLRPGRMLHLGAAGGRLEVLDGRVWLTRAGDADDHFVARGESVLVPPLARALVEALDDRQPALVSWRPRTLVERIGAALRTSADRCWEAVDPVRRVAVGAAAASLALLAGALVFGPLSDARTRALAGAALLHNSAAPEARQDADGRSTPRGTRADAGAEPRDRARGATQEAGRGAAGAA